MIQTQTEIQYGTEAWYRRDVARVPAVRVLESRIVDGQYDLHTFFPVDNWHPEDRKLMWEQIARMASTYEHIVLNKPNVAELRPIVAQFVGSPMFGRLYLLQAYTPWTIGLSIIGELRHNVTFKGTTLLIDAIENAGWTTKATEDDQICKWREFRMARKDRPAGANRLIVRISPHYNSDNCKMVETGEVEVKAKKVFVCDEEVVL